MKHRRTVCSIIEMNKKILLLKRGHTAPWYAGKYSFVCGVIEVGEKPKATAYREIQEETGLTKDDLELVKEARPLAILDTGLGITWHLKPFLFRTKKSTIRLDWENDGYAWVDPKELLHYPLTLGTPQILIKLMGDLPARKGVVAIVYKDEDSFLLVKTRSANVVFPSGGLEKGETEMDAVMHEVKEETGIAIDKNQIKRLPLRNNFTPKKGFLRWVKAEQSVYAVKVRGDEKIRPEGGDVVWARWFSKEDVLKNLSFGHLKRLFGRMLKYIEE